MSTLIKCLKCGVVHEHTTPITCKDITSYTCITCNTIGQAKVLVGMKGMFGG